MDQLLSSQIDLEKNPASLGVYKRLLGIEVDQVYRRIQCGPPKKWDNAVITDLVVLYDQQDYACGLLGAPLGKRRHEYRRALAIASRWPWLRDYRHQGREVRSWEALSYEQREFDGLMKFCGREKLNRPKMELVYRVLRAPSKRHYEGMSLMAQAYTSSIRFVELFMNAEMRVNRMMRDNVPRIEAVRYMSEVAREKKGLKRDVKVKLWRAQRFFQGRNWESDRVTSMIRSCDFMRRSWMAEDMAGILSSELRSLKSANARQVSDDADYASLMTHLECLDNNSDLLSRDARNIRKSVLDWLGY